MLEADYILPHRCWAPAMTAECARAHEILRYQKADGGWSIYPGGPSNISLTVKCYFAFKLMGMVAGASDPGPRRASGFLPTAA